MSATQRVKCKGNTSTSLFLLTLAVPLILSTDPHQTVQLVVCAAEQQKFHDITITGSCLEGLCAVTLAGCNYNSSV